MSKKTLITFFSLVAISGSYISPAKSHLKNGFGEGTGAFACFLLWEGYPNSLVEALSVGLPVVLSNRLRYLNDFVEDEINGKIVDDSDYLETIIKMINNKEKLKEMSKKSFNKYKILLGNSSVKNWIKLIK